MAVVENRIFVGSVPSTATKEDLQIHFEQYGATVDVYMPLVHGTGQHKGIGFVTYAVGESVQVAFNQPGHVIHGTPVTVEVCVAKGDKGGGKSKDKGAGNTALPGHVINGDRLFITKVPPDATKEEVEALFSRFGQWTDVYLPAGNFPAGHKGICFISYTDAQAAQLAIQCGPHQLRGQDLVVEIATPRGAGEGKGKGGGKAYADPYQAQQQQYGQQQQYAQQQQYFAPAVHQPVVVPAPDWSAGYPASPSAQGYPAAQAWSGQQMHGGLAPQQAWQAPQQPMGGAVGLKPGRLFLTKVGDEVTKEDLTMYFQQWGQLQDVYNPPGKSIAFVSFVDASVAQQLVGTPEHEVKLGSVVTVDLAYDRPPLEAKGKGKFRFQPYN